MWWLYWSGCAVDSRAPQEPTTTSEAWKEMVVSAAPAPVEEGEVGRGGAIADKKAEKSLSADAAPGKPADAEPDGANLGAAPEAGGEAVRTWFPEAFLWRPLVETDASGHARVDVKVPDQLTTWRVLGLAHTRDGHQGGAVATFDTRLPVYVDPVVPGWLYAGDQITLPVQVTNTTATPVSGALTVAGSGPLVGNGGGNVTLAPGASMVRPVGLKASGAGVAKVSAAISGIDAVIREVPVLPAGRPIVTRRGGVLSGERAFSLAAVAESDPSTSRMTVLVFPGPLSVLQAELERAGGPAVAGDPTGAANAAYGYSLASSWRTLAGRVGVATDETKLRRHQLRAWQRIARFSRAPTPADEVDLLLGLRDVRDDDTLAVALRDRLVMTVSGAQNGDGSWTRASQGTVSAMLVQTALTAHALPATATSARLRAKGSIQRQLSAGPSTKDAVGAVRDGYTAAVLAASGLVEGESKRKLQNLVVAATVDRDGRQVVVPAQAVNPWGERPTEAEFSAWAALALADRADLPWRGDLVADLVSNYRSDTGFGAGHADTIALEAVTALLPGLDKPVDVTMKVGGTEVARAKLDPTQPKLPAVLRAGAVGGAPVTLTVSQGVTGLAWVATREDWVPWTGGERLPGVDVTAHLSAFRVGHPGTVTLDVAAPSGTSVRLAQGLPPGTAVDTSRWGPETPQLASWRVTPDRVELTTRAFNAGEVMQIRIPVQPTFSGRFSTAPLRVAAVGDPSAAAVDLPPATWTIAP
jgi:hypothetical protein